MTFVDLQNNTTADADDVIGNFRHVNYGSNLIPVDVDGDGASGAIDIGSGTYKWRNGYFSGLIMPSGQYRIAGWSAEFSGTGTSCPNNAWTAVRFLDDTLAALDRVGITHPSPSTFTLQGQGIYFINGCITFVGNGTGIRGVGFRKVGSTVLRAHTIITGVATNDNTLNFSGYIKTSTSSDQIEMVAFQNSGSTLAIRATGTVDTSINPTQGATRFEIWRLA